jgi:hypothetical protein
LNDNRGLASPTDCDGWFVSSYTNGGGACVEVKFADPGVILVRDSKDRRNQRPIMSLPSHGWAALLGNVTK